VAHGGTRNPPRNRKGGTGHSSPTGARASAPPDGLCVPPRSHPRHPPSAESPFAPSRCYLLRGGIPCHLEGHYPFVLAHTGSCASPNSSPRLRSRYSPGSLQVAASPCWKRDLPDLISALLVWVLGPIPRGVTSVRVPASSRDATASPKVQGARHTEIPPQSSFHGASIYEAAVIHLCSGPHTR
jgi:hypothetical protein